MTDNYDIDPLAYLDAIRGLEDVWFATECSGPGIAVHYKDGMIVRTLVEPRQLGRTLDAVQNLIYINSRITDG